MSIDRPLSILNGIPDDEGVEDSAAFILDVRRAVEEALAILEADADRDSRAADNACNVQADVNANIEVNATQAVDVFISADAQLEYISATATFAVPPGVGDAPAALCDVAQTPANAPLRDPPVPLKTAGHPTGFAQVRGLGPAYAANVESAGNFVNGDEAGVRESEEDALESRWSESTVVPETAVTLAEGEKGGLSGSAEKS